MQAMAAAAPHLGSVREGDGPWDERLPDPFASSSATVAGSRAGREDEDLDADGREDDDHARRPDLRRLASSSRYSTHSLAIFSSWIRHSLIPFLGQSPSLSTTTLLLFSSFLFSSLLHGGLPLLVPIWSLLLHVHP
jgi:hypothetical protein